LKQKSLHEQDRLYYVVPRVTIS